VKKAIFPGTLVPQILFQGKFTPTNPPNAPQNDQTSNFPDHANLRYIISQRAYLANHAGTR